MIDPAAADGMSATLLPDNFARNVLTAVRAQRRRERRRQRLAASAACAALLLGLTFTLGRNLRGPVAPPSEAATNSYLWQTRWDSNLDQLAAADAPDGVNDYLAPAAASWSTADSSDASLYSTGDLDWQS